MDPSDAREQLREAENKELMAQKALRRIESEEQAALKKAYDEALTVARRIFEAKKMSIEKENCEKFISNHLSFLFFHSF